MKKLLGFTAAILFSLGLTGCYTVIWDPDMDFPTADDSEYYDEYDSYYSDTYYGDYHYFYGYPWWYNITPPTRDAVDNHSRTSDTQSIRNNTSTRNSSGDRKNIINTSPATTDKNDGNSGSNKTSNTRSNEQTSQTVKDNDSSGSNNSSTRGSSSGSSNNVRNNDGGRNNGGRR